MTPSPMAEVQSLSRFFVAAVDSAAVLQARLDEALTRDLVTALAVRETLAPWGEGLARDLIPKRQVATELSLETEVELAIGSELTARMTIRPLGLAFERRFSKHHRSTSRLRIEVRALSAVGEEPVGDPSHPPSRGEAHHGQ